MTPIVGSEERCRKVECGTNHFMISRMLSTPLGKVEEKWQSQNIFITF